MKLVFSLAIGLSLPLSAVAADQFPTSSYDVHFQAPSPSFRSIHSKTAAVTANHYFRIL